jgi:copper oxidase (laccase) domain-containing protein
MTRDRAVTAEPTLAREEPVADAAVPRLELRGWAERYGVLAGITTRGHGFNLGLWTEENSAPVVTRWRAFRTALGARFPAVVSSHQVHGATAVWHDRRADGWLILDDVDGHGTAIEGLLLTVSVADCIPVYLAVPDKGAVALLHGGWRGIVAGILERGVELLKRHAYARAADIVMHCGVGICGDCYEVGPEVATRFSGEPEVGPRRLDLRDILARQAHALGITGVTRSPWCSAHDRASFFSHRASGGREGRMVAYLGRPLA